MFDESHKAFMLFIKYSDKPDLMQTNPDKYKSLFQEHNTKFIKNFITNYNKIKKS
jgi:hypothetical protein